MNDASTPLSALGAALAAFNHARDWGQFHTPRDLAMALSVEVGEVLELFLWRAESAERPPAERLREELGDVLICLVNLAQKVDVDLMDAAQAKLALNAAKYPVERARGNATKWSELGAAEAPPLPPVPERADAPGAGPTEELL